MKRWIGVQGVDFGKQFIFGNTLRVNLQVALDSDFGGDFPLLVDIGHGGRVLAHTHESYRWLYSVEVSHLGG